MHPAATETLPDTATHTAASRAAPGMSATSGPLDDAGEFAQGEEEEMTSHQGNAGKMMRDEVIPKDEIAKPI